MQKLLAAAGLAADELAVTACANSSRSSTRARRSSCSGAPHRFRNRKSCRCSWRGTAGGLAFGKPIVPI